MTEVQEAVTKERIVEQLKLKVSRAVMQLVEFSAAVGTHMPLPDKGLTRFLELYIDHYKVTLRAIPPHLEIVALEILQLDTRSELYPVVRANPATFAPLLTDLPHLPERVTDAIQVVLSPHKSDLSGAKEEPKDLSIQIPFGFERGFADNDNLQIFAIRVFLYLKEDTEQMAWPYVLNKVRIQFGTWEVNLSEKNIVQLPLSWVDRAIHLIRPAFRIPTYKARFNALPIGILDLTKEDLADADKCSAQIGENIEKAIQSIEGEVTR